MKNLSEAELASIIQQGNELSENKVTAILDHFKKNQPEIYQAIYGIFSDAIAEVNLEMAHLFIDLCFDIIWMYRMAFGNPPVNAPGMDWLNNKLSLLDVEMKSINEEESMNGKFRKHLQNRFVNRSIEAGIQLELLKYLEEKLQNYASFQEDRQKVTLLTSNLIFVIVRLMSDLYSEKNIS